MLLKQDSLSSESLDYMSEFGPVMGGWFCPSHVLFCGKTSVSGLQLDSQTFFILNVVFYVIGTGI